MRIHLILKSSALFKVAETCQTKQQLMFILILSAGVDSNIVISIVIFTGDDRCTG